MSSDVVLTSALRNNLLSLQNTQRLIDDTQLRLATGLEVNSALDNPQNFFAAQSLNNRANDLSRLLDGIGQSIRTIETADGGVTALTSLVEQAQSIVNQARDELAASEGEARIVGSVDLSDEDNLTDLANIANTGLDFRIITTDASGTQITEEIALNDGDTGFDLAARITNQFADNQNGEITANLTDEGFLSIQSSDGRSFRIVDGDVAGPGATPVTLAGFTDLGLGNFFEDETRAGVALASTTVVAGNTATSISLFESTGNLVEAGDALTGAYTDADGTTVFSGFEATDTINITLDIDGTATAPAAVFTIAAGDTFQDLVDYINQDANIGDFVEASFDSSTGQLSITSLDDSVRNVELSLADVAGTANVFNIGLGDTTGNLDPITVAGTTTQEVVFAFNNSTETLDALAGDYNSLREQIDRLVVDAQYRGINLLNGDDLTTFFNEDSTSTLTTQGVDFTSNGLGITEATFRSSTEIELSATQSRDALESVRSFGSSLANDLAIITSRRDFTENTINTLRAGADDLTVADQNEEGANLLALQTRQTLGVTSLSLASQSQQSVLRLF